MKKHVVPSKKQHSTLALGCALVALIALSPAKWNAHLVKFLTFISKSNIKAWIPDAFVGEPVPSLKRWRNRIGCNVVLIIKTQKGDPNILRD